MLSCEQPSINNYDQNTKESKDFYSSPLCRSGYLTPLQRKKLREKRKLNFIECEEELGPKSYKKIKISPISKAKTEDSISKKAKKRLTFHKKSAISSPQVQFTVAKFFNKTVDDNTDKVKKFFKTPSASRLEKANFTMPLVLKKNMFSNCDKKIKSDITNQWNTEASDSVMSDDDARPFVINVKPYLISSSENSEEHLNASNIQNLSSVDKIPLSEPEVEEVLFDFEWPPDDILLKRQEKARSVKRDSLLKELNTHTQDKRTEDKQNHYGETSKY